MKYFKTSAARSAPRYLISARNFALYTENKPPFEQIGDDKKIRQYGICPSCLNPVRLIGIDKEIKRHPYGEHAGKSIDGFPKWNLYKYRHCPFAKTGDKRPIDENERGVITEDTVELFELLKAHFDRVVLIIRKDFGIIGSYNFWQRALQQFYFSEGYCYPWLTEANLPYVFAFFGLQHQNPYKQQIRADSELFAALCKYPKIDFDSTSSEKYPQIINRGNQFVNLYFRLTDHRQKAKEGSELKESIKFCVDDRDNGKTIYEKRIEFDETYFTNLINKSDNEDKRNKQLLELAAECLPSIKADI